MSGFKRVAAAVVGLALTAALLTGCSEPRAQAQTTPPAAIDTVTSVGDGKAAAAPDRAQVEFSVEVDRADSKKALGDASAAAKKVTKALQRAGVAKDDLQTSNVNMYPNRNPQNRVTGYHASITVRAEIDDIGKVGDLIAAGTNAGATNFSGPAFYLSDENEAHDRAIEAAVEDARGRAEVMAKAAGKRVGGVVAISEAPVNAGPLPMYQYRAEAAAKDMALSSVPIEAGQLDAQAQVTVVFELR